MAKRSSFGPMVLVLAAASCSFYVACGDDDVIIGQGGTGGTAGSGGGGGTGGGTAGDGGNAGTGEIPDGGDAGDAPDTGSDAATSNN